MNELNSDELILLDDLLKKHRGETLYLLIEEEKLPNPNPLILSGAVKILELNKSISKKLLGE